MRKIFGLDSMSFAKMAPRLFYWQMPAGPQIRTFRTVREPQTVILSISRFTAVAYQEECAIREYQAGLWSAL
jgi:hypothetical protein